MWQFFKTTHHNSHCPAYLQLFPAHPLVDCYVIEGHILANISKMGLPVTIPPCLGITPLSNFYKVDQLFHVNERDSLLVKDCSPNQDARWLSPRLVPPNSLWLWSIIDILRHHLPWIHDRPCGSDSPWSTGHTTHLPSHDHQQNPTRRITCCVFKPCNLVDPGKGLSSCNMAIWLHCYWPANFLSLILFGIESRLSPKIDSTPSSDQPHFASDACPMQTKRTRLVNDWISFDERSQLIALSSAEFK